MAEAEAEAEDICYNDEWINEYKKEETKYDIFYKKEVSSIKLFFIYLANTQDNGVKEIKKENYNIINKSINKKELKKIIKQHDNKYILDSIFKYNITLNPDEIEDFINNDENENNYMNNIILKDEDEDEEDDNILFENTIDFFKELNAIYIIYTENVE